MQRGTKEDPDALYDASATSLTQAVGRAEARSTRRRRKTTAPPSEASAVQRLARMPARRARSSLPPLPYGARVSVKARAKASGKAAVAAGNASTDDNDRDDDDGSDSAEDEDVWDDGVATDASAAAAVVASLAAAEAEAAAAAFADAAAGGMSTKEQEKARMASAKAELKRKRFAARLESFRFLNRYQLHVTLLCALQLRVDDAASAPELQAVALSVVPRDAVLSLGATGSTLETLRRFALWFRCTYHAERLAEGVPMRRLCDAVERALACVDKQRGDILDLVVCAAAALRGSGVRCRVVLPMQPGPFKPPPSSAKLKNVTGRAVASAVVDRKVSAGLYAWLEVFVGTRWIHVDPVAGLVDATNEKDIGQAIQALDAQPQQKGSSSSASASTASSKRRKANPPSGLPQSSSRGATTMAVIRSRPQLRHLPRKCLLSHVVAVENSIVVDVTRRYVATWQDVQKERPPSGLFEKTIAKCCGQLSANGRTTLTAAAAVDRVNEGPVDSAMSTTVSVGSLDNILSAEAAGGFAESTTGGVRSLEQKVFTGRGADKLTDVAAVSEQLEFDRRAMKETVPTTLKAIQYHPVYAIERHLKRYEAIFPREPVLGYVGPDKEPVFLRSHVRTLHTRDRWYREMRDVKDGMEPIKKVMSKLKRDVQGASLLDSADLFGEWQTEALFIPPVQNGIVPRGPHGNVELWTPAHLPLGATHVEAAHAAPAARQLGFDFVPCMTGFDIRSGRSVPRIEGIVVASEVADVVRDAAAAASLQVSELAAERSRAEAQARWKELIGRVKARQRIQNKYGHGVEDNPVATYATVQERRGVEKCRREAAPAGSSQDPSEAAESRSRSVAKERASADIDSQGEEDLRSTKYSKGTLPSDPHNHAYGPARRHEGDVWIKVCNICGIEVAFEKF